AGRRYAVELAPDEREPAPLSRVLPGPRDRVALVAAHRGEPPPGWEISFLRGEPPFTLVRADGAEGASVAMLGHPSHLSVTLRRAGGCFVQVGVGSAPALCMALPATAVAGSSCTLVSDERTGPPVMAAYPVDEFARLATQYLAFHDAENGAQLFPDRTMDRLTAGRRSNAVAAAVGGYLLLRCGRVDQLDRWARRLTDRFPWLPDGSVIAGEVAALTGEHRSATDHFLEATRRGLPTFTD